MKETVKSWLFRFAPIWHTLAALCVAALIAAGWLPADFVSAVGGREVLIQHVATVLAVGYAISFGVSVTQHSAVTQAQRDAGTLGDGYIGPETRDAWRTGGVIPRAIPVNPATPEQRLRGGRGTQHQP
jgi:hypothetical protein